MMHEADSSARDSTNNSTTWIKLLVIYFSILIVLSLFFSVWIWKPTTQSPGTNTTQIIFLSTNKSSNFMHTPPNTTKSITTTSNGTTIRNSTIYPVRGNLSKEVYYTAIIPSSLEREIRLVELSLLFGVVGASVQAVRSLATWHSRKKLEKSFVSWYITKPVIGAALAVTVYSLLRSSLLTTSMNGIGGTAFINVYGVAGISVLVGLMTVQITKKLRDVFDSLFGIEKGTDKGDIEVAEHNITLTPKELKIGKGNQSVLVAVVKDNSNNPISGRVVEFGIVDNSCVKPVEGSSTTQITDTNGMAMLNIKGGENKGKTNVHAATDIDDKTDYATSTVEVKD